MPPHKGPPPDVFGPLARYLALMVVFHFPAPGQLQLFVGEHVEKSHKVPVVLVAFKVVGVPPDFGDHVLQTRVVCKHAVGTLEKGWRTKVNPWGRQEPHIHMGVSTPLVGR